MDLMYIMRTYAGFKERAKWQAVFSTVIEVWVSKKAEQFLFDFQRRTLGCFEIMILDNKMVNLL